MLGSQNEDSEILAKKISGLENLICGKNNEIGELSSELESLKNNYAEVERQASVADEQKQINGKLMVELNRVNKLLADKKSEMDGYKANSEKLTGLKSALDELRRKNDFLENENQDLYNNIENKQTVIDGLRNQIITFEQEIMDQQSKVNKLRDALADNDRLKTILADKSKTIDDLSLTLQKLESEGLDRDSLLEQNRHLRSEIERYIVDLGNSRKEQDHLRNENSILGSNVNSLDLQNSELRCKNEEELIKISSTQNQNKELSNLLSIAESDLKDLRSKLINHKELETSFDDLKKEHRSLLEKVPLFFFG